ncbi:LLM class flavin-dependent oxidoreductase [Pseudonocardia acaciae]|uniref:LLM class flavin-dependent oxidoreductase n=1 Tax=Pseudonocardia acaciae TaxID=551276 RepID=UPI0006853861|nr:LLM class flavin-dependent oxidoreductase [Pseudonocardia acaciae]
MTTRIGLLLPSREVTMWADGDVGRLVDAAVAAEADRFDSVWVGDSLLARPRPEPVVTQSAIAARTSRIQLGTAVLLPLLRHPLTLAHSLATLDRLANGRLVVGLAPGSDVPGTHAELAAVGRRGDRRVGDLLDTVAEWRRLWAGDNGPRPRPSAPAGPPLWLGAQGPRLLRLTGSRFDGWMPFSPTPADYARGLEAVRHSAKQAGRDPGEVSPAAYLTVAIADDKADADRALDAYMTEYYGQPAEVMARIQGCYTGDLDGAVDWARGYVEAGAAHLIIRFAEPGLTGYHPLAGELRARLSLA